MNFEGERPEPGQRYVVQVFPSKAALNQKLQSGLQQSPNQVLLHPRYYTFDNLLNAILADVPLPPGRTPLAPLAGPLLVQDLISQYRGSAGPLSGVAQGRRLPARLWRLLVEIKAAGLTPQAIERLEPSDQLATLAGLLRQYNQSLDRLGLEDQADLLGRAEGLMEQGQAPPLMRDWAEMQALQVLWLRALDLRLLKMISRIMPVKVRFGLTPQSDDPLYKLCQGNCRIS